MLPNWTFNEIRRIDFLGDVNAHESKYKGIKLLCFLFQHGALYKVREKFIQDYIGSPKRSNFQEALNSAK